MKKSPQKGNWLSAGDTYAVHLMPATIDKKEGMPMDPATHFALQVTDLSKVLATLLAAGQKPYQLSLQVLRSSKTLLAGAASNCSLNGMQHE
jgi:hypothetical protein